jgi:hypothetical protein
MDSLTLASNLITAFAWPMAIVALALVFKRDIALALGRVDSLKGPGGVHLGFTKSLERGEAISEKVAIDRSQSNLRDIPPTLNAAELELATTYPEGAIERSYKEVEARLLELRAQLPDNKPHRNLDEVMKWLKESGHLTQSAVDLWRAIRESRRQAYGLNPRRISSIEAVGFGTQAKQLLEILRTISIAK